MSIARRRLLFAPLIGFGPLPASALAEEVRAIAAGNRHDVPPSDVAEAKAWAVPPKRPQRVVGLLVVLRGEGSVWRITDGEGGYVWDLLPVHVPAVKGELKEAGWNIS